MCYSQDILDKNFSFTICFVFTTFKCLAINTMIIDHKLCLVIYYVSLKFTFDSLFDPQNLWRYQHNNT